MKRRTKKSFTLVEVVVASLLLTVAMVPILKALTASHMLDKTIEYRTRGLILAQAKLEEIRAESIYDYGTNFSEASSVVEGSYLCTVLDGPVNADLRRITVSVGYDRNVNGVLESDEVEVTLRTLLARRW